MYRRELMGGGTVLLLALVAGCSEEDGGNGGNDDEPIDAAPEELLLTIEDFDEEGWSASEVETEENSATASFVRSDPNESIDVRVFVYETVEAARDEYQGRNDELAEKWDIRNVDVGVEGFGYNGGVTGVIFRDANVLGRVYHFYEYSNGQIGVAGDYAQKMHQRWRE